ncbi:MAG: SulP family inorganic anion transporter [Proteobacteria bacterium]|nr:SulP family inorganic anion transporter [Pseudomonadota bacterium]
MLKRLLPFLAWPAPTRASLRDDLVAGTSVALILIPQALAYAQLAGVPAYWGLYAAMLPAVIGALFGSSAWLATGPVALTALLSAASIAPFATQGSDAFLAHTIALALLSGLIQVAFGLARGGMLFSLLSHPVLMGFINAATLLIALSQLPTLLGIKVQTGAHFLYDTWHLAARLGETHLPSLAFGIVAIGMLLAFRRFAPRLPGVLVTVAVLTAASYFRGYAAAGGRVVGAIPQGLPALALPAVDFEMLQNLIPAAFVIALISFMEAMSSARVIAAKTRTDWNENQELIGQGLAKITASLCQSLPVSGSFSRSAILHQAGGRSGLASVFSALLVLLTLLFLTGLLHHLPLPVLAAIIMVAVLNLANPGAIRRAWRASRDDGAAAIGTFAATLLFAPNIQNGILTGILLSLALFLYRGMTPRAIAVGLHADGTLRDAARFDLPPLHPLIGILRFDAALNFVNAATFEDAVLKLERERPGIRFLLVAAGGINELDASGAEMLFSLAERLRADGVTLVISAAKKQITDVMERIGLDTAIGRDNMYSTDRFAIDGLLARAEEK